MSDRASLLVVALLLALSPSCTSKRGGFVWVDAYDVPQTAPEYVIATGDVLTIRVWGHDEVTTRAKVRDDGQISLPLLGDVEARGQRPEQLAEKLQLQFKPFFVNPAVTVALEETRPRTVSIAGEIVRPGVYPIGASTGVLEIISNAGGLTNFADRSGIYILRRSAEKVDRIRMSWDSLVKAEGRAAAFRLQDGDQVVVE